MKKTHPNSRMVQFHHNSPFANKLLGVINNNEYIVLQLEPVEHKGHDFIAEIVNKDQYKGETKNEQ